MAGTHLPSKNLLKGIKYENKEGVTGTLSTIYQWHQPIPMQYMGEEICKLMQGRRLSINYYRNVFYKGYDEEKIPFRTIKELISAGANLPHILPKNYSQLLELHLKQLKELSHTKGIYRIDVRKRH